MWVWHKDLNIEANINKNIIDNFKKNAKISGIIFIILGIAGIVFPPLMTLTTVIFIGYLMIIAGLYAGFMTYKSNPKDWIGWLKSFILFLTGLLIIFYPINGAAALGLLFAIFFFIDSFGSFSIALSLKPQKAWLVWLLNALVSLVIAVLFLIHWPVSSIFLIGILVGVSLLFDGMALLFGGIFLEDVDDSAENKSSKSQIQGDKK